MIPLRLIQAVYRIFIDTVTMKNLHTVLYIQNQNTLVTCNYKIKITSKRGKV